MRNRTAAAAIVLTTLVASVGCTAQASTPPATHAPASSRAAPSGPSSTVPTLTPTAAASTPLGAGERVWAAFSQRGLPYTAWWAQLRPQLSESAQAVYVYDDPLKIPSMTITGKIHLAAKAPAEPKYTAEVLVPTSKGVFALDLERHTIGSRWLLYAIRFPTGVR